MNWYITKLCFEIKTGSEKAQAEEQIRIVNAVSEAQAYEKAILLGKKQMTSVQHSEGNIVEWIFLGIRCLYLLPQLADETEIFSTVVETNDIIRYKKDIQLFNSEIGEQFKNDLVIS